MTIEVLLGRVKGMPLDEAEALIREKGYTPRRVSRDGIAFIVTRDYRSDRINLATAAGSVIHASIG